MRALLDEHGRTYAAEAGIRVERNTPSARFQLLVLSILLSARIPARNALEAAEALCEAGLTTPRRMEASWRDRVDVLTAHGYKRYDESAARMLGDTAELLLEAYGGDLRGLREAADRDVDEERRRLQRFEGIGRVGAEIFLREVQVAWDEMGPFADRKVLQAARRVIPGDRTSPSQPVTP